MANSEESTVEKKTAEGRLRSNSYDRAMSSGEQRSPSEPPKIQTIPSDESHLIKWIEFNKEHVPILLQNMNGPCPLLALANILLLRKQMSFNPNTKSVSTDRVITSIANLILQLDPSKLSAERRVNFEYNIEDVLAVLPKLKTGMDINLKFNGVDKFEYTREYVIFDLLNIQLYHGWVIDPQDAQLQKIINSNGSSYNQLVEKMIDQKQSNQENLAQESLLIEQFFEDNRSQLTHYGILRLNETMQDNQLAVFFRNNHFSTIWKNKRQLLLLVSDQGYINHPSIVFETLTDTDNDSTFTDGYGQTWRKPAPENTSRDRDLAVAIQNQERHRYEQQRPYEEKSSKKKHRKPSRRDDDGNDDRCILS